MTPAPEVWLRGPIEGISPQLQPVAHALLQAMEDADHFTAGTTTDELWTSVAGAATVGFHLRHMAGSLDRLFTYARGEPLSDAQKAALAGEKEVAAGIARDELLRRLRDAIERALQQLGATADGTLDEVRTVGRSGYPSTVRGLLHHAGEHTARHAGQISTTVKILRGIGSGAR